MTVNNYITYSYNSEQVEGSFAYTTLRLLVCPKTYCIFIWTMD